MVSSFQMNEIQFRRNKLTSFLLQEARPLAPRGCRSRGGVLLQWDRHPRQPDQPQQNQVRVSMQARPKCPDTLRQDDCHHHIIQEWRQEYPGTRPLRPHGHGEAASWEPWVHRRPETHPPRARHSHHHLQQLGWQGGSGPVPGHTTSLGLHHRHQGDHSLSGLAEHNRGQERGRYTGLQHRADARGAHRHPDHDIHHRLGPACEYHTITGSHVVRRKSNLNEFVHMYSFKDYAPWI